MSLKVSVWIPHAALQLQQGFIIIIIIIIIDV